MTREARPDCAGGSASSQDGTGRDKPAGRKRRRWRLKLVLLLTLLVLLILCLPYLISTGPGTRLVVSVADGRLPGSLALEDLSVSWSGPCKIKGLRLSDPEGREVARVEGATLASGVWRGVTSPFRFDELTIDQPHVVLYTDDRGEVSLLRAIGAARKPAAPKESGPLPALTGQLAIRDGSIQVVRPDGRMLEIPRIDGDISVESLGKIAGKLVVEVARVGTITGEVNVEQLVRAGRLQPLEAKGTAVLKTSDDFSLVGLGEFAMGEARTDGTARVRVEAAFAAGEVKVESTMSLAGLQVRSADRSSIQPVDLQVTGEVRATRESLNVRAALDGQIGAGLLDLSYPWAGQVGDVSLDNLLSAALAGKAVKWPEAVVEGKLRIDVARLAQAVPALLRVHPNVVVTGGELDVERVVVRGGESPSTTGAAALRNLTSRRDGQQNEWEPMALNWDLRIEPGRGLRAEHVAFTAGFGRMAAQGSPSDLHADFQSDLARLKQQIDQVFDLGGVELAGGTGGTLDLKRVGPDRIDLAMVMTAEGLRYRDGDRRLEVAKVLVKKNGHFTLDGSRVTRVTMSDVTWDADGRMTGKGSGWAAIGDGKFEAEMNLERADLAYMADRLADLGLLGAAGYAGEVTLHAQVGRPSQDAPIFSDGRVVLKNTRLRDEPLFSGDVSCVWERVAIGPGENEFAIKSVDFRGPPAHLAVTNVSLRSGPEASADGKVEGDADLAQCMAIWGRIAGRATPPDIAGRLGLSIASAGSATGAKISGNARIDGLAVGAGDKSIREDKVDLVTRLALDRQSNTVAVDQFQIESQMLAMRVAGRITDYARTCLLDLSGDYRASWDSITALIHELAPATAEKLTVAGTSQARFTVTGPAHQPQVRHVLGDATGSTEVAWFSANVCGVRMGKALLAPSLKQGRLVVPVSVIPASGGQVRLGGEVDFRQPTPVLSLGRQLQVLENIRITPELGRELLSRVNPIFGSLASAEGTVSLTTEDIQLPLGEGIKRGGSGRGHLDLRNLKVQPSGILMTLFELGGLTGGEHHVVQASGVDFHLKEGRLFYENFALTFGRDFDLRFHGSVGFDDTLDLAVSVPVRPTLLERLGVAGSTGEYARRLAKARVEIPILGTRLNPRMDLAQVDLKPLIEEAARSAVSQGTDDLLERLMGVKQAGKPEAPVTGTGRPTPSGVEVAPRQSLEGRKVPEKPKEVSVPRPVKPETRRSVERAPKPAEPAVREPARLPPTQPADRQELKKAVATRRAPATRESGTPAIRERLKRSAPAPASRPAVGDSVATRPARPAVESTRPAVPRRITPLRPRPGSQPG